MKFDFFLQKKIRYKPAKRKEYPGPVPNPGRGWYRIFYFYMPDQPDFKQLSWCLRQDETLVMAIIHIGAYRDSALDQIAIDTVAQILDFFREKKKDIILRFTYDCEGKGLQSEPALFSQIKGHIQQLSPIIQTYTKSIFVLQGLFVGNWGEMHGSKFLSNTYLRKLNALVEAAAGEHTWLASRKPSQWRILHSPNEKYVRMGLFDDGIFGSETNLGTFGYLKNTQTEWENSWCPEDELTFEEQLCRKVPHGGEVVRAQQMPERTNTDVIRGLRRMHISYLNCAHDAKLLDTWRQKQSAWPGISFFDYVGAHLGYRFCVRTVKVQKKKEQFRIEVAFENTGFAPCYEEYDVTLELETTDGILQQETSWDLRTLMSGTIKCFQSELPKVKGKLYLSARRNKDGSILRFAHEMTDDGKLFLGELK